MMAFSLNLRRKVSISRNLTPDHRMKSRLALAFLAASVVGFAMLAVQPAHADKLTSIHSLASEKSGAVAPDFDAFSVRITSECTGSYLIIKLRNEGLRWKQRVKIDIIERTQSRRRVTREMVMNEGQTGTFRLPMAGKCSPTIVRISPKWLNQSVIQELIHSS